MKKVAGRIRASWRSIVNGGVRTVRLDRDASTQKISAAARA